MSFVNLTEDGLVDAKPAHEFIAGRFIHLRILLPLLGASIFYAYYKDVFGQALVSINTQINPSVTQTILNIGLGAQ